MAQNITPFSLTAPGFWGLNTADAPVDMDDKFALEANNCVIDKYGRVGSRKGWTPAHSTAASLGSASPGCIREQVQDDGTRLMLVWGNNKLFKLVGTTLTEITYGGGGVPPTITGDNWQAAGLNNSVVFFQSGHDPLFFDVSMSATQYKRISEHPSYSGTVPKGNCVISAYGRIWAASTTTNKNTVYWTDVLTDSKWSGGSAGSLDLLGVWPQGGDEIVALAAHNNALIIFGSKQILVYTGADNPTTMKLSDAIASTGCVARDTVANTGEDIIFLSDTGVRSIQRTIQEKSAPLRNLSRNVNTDIQTYIAAETSTSNIKAVYSPIDSFYLLTFIGNKMTYCFDMKAQLQDGSSRVTTWVGFAPTAYSYSKDRILYLGMPGYLAKYYGNTDNGTSYSMTYYTSWLDFGNPIQTSILKKITMTLFGASNQAITYKWGFDYLGASHSQTATIAATSTVAEYGIAEYGLAEYSDGMVIKNLSMSVGGAGRVMQVGMEVPISTAPISVQRIDIFTKDGKFA